jgi:hypothetical protein
MLFQNGSISGSMATKEDARQPGNPGTLKAPVLFLSSQNDKKHCIPCCFLIFEKRMLFQLLAAFDAGPGDGLPLIRHLFVRKTQI